MTTTSDKTTSGGTRVHVQRFGTFLSGMVMPNIAAFIAWGIITAFFIPTGWTPNSTLVALVDPMILYLLPLLIANTGGRMVYGTRGGVIASIATMGVIVGSSIPMFIGAMLMGLSNGVASRIAMTDSAYPLRGTGLSTLLSAEWRRPEERARAEQWIAEYGAALRPWARRAYVNYLGPSAPARIRDVYGENYPRLAQIKAKYDPANLFRSNQNILPAGNS